MEALLSQRAGSLAGVRMPKSVSVGRVVPVRRSVMVQAVAVIEEEAAAPVRSMKGRSKRYKAIAAGVSRKFREERRRPLRALWGISLRQAVIFHYYHDH